LVLISFTISHFVVRYSAPAIDVSAAETRMLPVVDFGPPSPEALAWKSTSAGDSIFSHSHPILICILELAPGGADYLLAYAAMRSQQTTSKTPDSIQYSLDTPSRPASS
jgi:hypothetical protein